MTVSRKAQLNGNLDGQTNVASDQKLGRADEADDVLAAI